MSAWTLAGVTITAVLAGFALGHHHGVRDAPEVAAALREDAAMTRQWIDELESRPAPDAPPRDREDFCAEVLDDAAHVLDTERLRYEGDANEAAHDARR